MNHVHAGQPILVAGRPLGESRAAVIMLHGRGAGPENILDLVPQLDRPAFTYLAPAAAGRTWYPYSFLAPREQNEPGLSSGLRVIGSLVDDLVGRGIRREHIVLLGFSQGACLTAEFAFEHPARYGGVVIFSGGVIGVGSVRPTGQTRPPDAGSVRPTGQTRPPDADGPFAGTPVFFGCSDTDAHVPKSRVDESAALFTRLGAQVVERIYPGMGHLVNDDEILAARTIMDTIDTKGSR
jgi:predicted esterase